MHLQKSLDFSEDGVIIVVMKRNEQKVSQILKDLDKKMVFLSGPRQVGKTWLAQKIQKSFTNTLYLNYDVSADRQVIKKGVWPTDLDLLILDELHKMKGWKNFLKGLYDSKPAGMRILVTGSARLDTFRKSGDSLAGRFFSHHLLPFSPAELKGTTERGNLARLLERGGFPEPFLASNADMAQRWRNQYIEGLTRTDVLDISSVKDLRAIEDVLQLLRRQVGSPVSYESIARDVAVSPAVVKRYIQILEALFIIFTLRPYSRRISRSILKRPKIYFFDNGLVIGDEGALFENLVANSLLKHLYGLNDIKGTRQKLHYLRTKDGKEVDFIIADESGIISAIEAKVSDIDAAKNLKYFKKRYDIKDAHQVVLHAPHKQLEEGGIKIYRALEYLEQLFA